MLNECCKSFFVVKDVPPILSNIDIRIFWKYKIVPSPQPVDQKSAHSALILTITHSKAIFIFQLDDVNLTNYFKRNYSWQFLILLFQSENVECIYQVLYVSCNLLCLPTFTFWGNTNSTCFCLPESLACLQLDCSTSNFANAPKQAKGKFKKKSLLLPFQAGAGFSFPTPSFLFLRSPLSITPGPSFLLSKYYDKNNSLSKY